MRSVTTASSPVAPSHRTLRPLRTRRAAALVPVLVFLATRMILGGTIVVDDDGPADHSSIQVAIDSSVDGDWILVEPGVYTENIDFLGKAITVQSVSGATVTTIDGSACTTGAGSCSVVTFASGEGTDSILEGFTITGGTAGGGGGIYVGTASPVILSCVITGNSADEGGGLFVAFGGGSGATEISNSTISGNTAPVRGGGMVNAGALELVNVEISDNVTAGPGGGIANLGAVTLINCPVRGNAAGSGGGGVSHPFLFPGPCGIINAMNCTFSGNSPSGLHSENARINVFNSIFWNNGQEILVLPCPDPPDPKVRYSIVMGGYPGEGNLDVDPLLVDPAGGNLHLLPCSPAVDAGVNAPGLPATDFDGDPRIENGTVDLGVDEVVGGPAPCNPLFVRGDSDGNGVFDALTDGIHLLEFGFLGGSAPPCLEAAEVDGDGVLNTVVDGIYILTHGFLGGPPPGAPYPFCGNDLEPTTGLDCDISVCP